MNDRLSIAVDATLDHGTYEKKCVASCTKMRRNGKKRVHIINGLANFVTLIKMHGACKFDSTLELDTPIRY